MCPSRSRRRDGSRSTVRFRPPPGRRIRPWSRAGSPSSPRPRRIVAGEAPVARATAAARPTPRRPPRPRGGAAVTARRGPPTTPRSASGWPSHRSLPEQFEPAPHVTLLRDSPLVRRRRDLDRWGRTWRRVRGGRRGRIWQLPRSPSQEVAASCDEDRHRDERDEHVSVSSTEGVRHRSSIQGGPPALPAGLQTRVHW